MQVASLGRVTELEVDRPTESTYLLYKHIRQIDPPILKPK